MTKGLKIERNFRLPTPPAEVWDSLVNPCLIQKYKANTEIASALPSVSCMEQCPGFSSGDILEYEESRKVKFSTFDPEAGLNDQPQNYLHITYELGPADDGTELRVLIENFMPEGDRYEYSAAGWNQMVQPALENLGR